MCCSDDTKTTTKVDRDIRSILSDEIRGQYGVEVIGYAHEVMVRYYAISIERRLTHPAVVAVTEAAKQSLFIEGDSIR